MKIIFFLLVISFSFEQNYICKNLIPLNSERPISGFIDFEFCLSNRLEERDTIYIEMHYSSETGECDPYPTLRAGLVEDGDDDEDNSFYFPNSQSSRGNQCFIKYSFKLKDDVSRIGFEISLQHAHDNLYVKIYIKSSILWIIILCVCLGLVVIGVGIGLFVYFYKKRETKSVINEPLSPEVEPVFKPSIENSQN